MSDPLRHQKYARSAAIETDPARRAYLQSVADGDDDGAAIIRLPATTMTRKRAYLKAANKKPLAEWMFEQCDKVAGYTD